MRIVSNKGLRRAVNAVLGLTPRKYRVAADQWLRGRQEFKKLQAADYVVVSYGKSGRTWVRTLISRCYQARYNLPEGSVIGFDNFHKASADIPKIFFTHDHYLKYYTGRRESKQDYYGKKIILLVRDPRDVAVSNYFQRKYRANELSRKLHSAAAEDMSLFEYATRFSIPRSIGFLKQWASETDSLDKFMIVRYEDLRANTAQNLARVLDFLGMPARAEDIEDAISWASFENMKKREQEQSFQTGDRRLFGGNQANPDSFKVRRGKVGGYRDYFSDQECAALKQLIQAGLPDLYAYG